MAEYTFVPTGGRVVSDRELRPPLFKPVKTAKAATRAATAKAATSKAGKAAAGAKEG